MIKNCHDCGKEFITYHSKILLGRGKYCSKECCLKRTTINLQGGLHRRFVKGQAAHNFKGWTTTLARRVSQRYVLVYAPEHPFCTKKGYVRKHRLIIEAHVGRYLRKDEVVDHIDGNGLNNDISNLRLMSKVEHDRMNTHLNIHKRWQKSGLNQPSSSSRHGVI